MSRRLWLLPREKREWGEAYLAEFGDEATLGRLIFQAWCLTLAGGSRTKTAVYTLSILNGVAGLTVAAFSLVTMPGSRVVPLVALGLATQGAYTLWVALIKPRSPRRSRLLLVGQTMALVLGVMGLFNATVTTLSSSDPEYGPATLAGLITAQAAVTLYAYAIRTEPATD